MSTVAYNRQSCHQHTSALTCSVVGNVRHNDVLLFLNNQRVPVVETFKCLSVKFAAKNSLYVDVPFIKRKFYAACNGVLNKCRRSCETVQVHLISSFCLPFAYLLHWCFGISPVFIT